MKLRSIVAAAVLGVAVTAYGPGKSSSEADGTWVGTIITEGDGTTVVNESGSVWGGTAMLVEEASIGVESGADPYMLRSVPAIAVSEDQLYVADLQVPALRVYDWNGDHLRDLGREGAKLGRICSNSQWLTSWRSRPSVALARGFLE